MPVESYSQDNPRLQVFYLIFCFLFLVLALGLAYRQLVQSREYQEQERLQNYRRVLLPAPRGNIYDREGRLLVGNRPVYSAVVYLDELRREFRQEYFHLVNEARSLNLKRNRQELNTEARRNVVQGYLNQINRLLGRDLNVISEDLERQFGQDRLLPFPLVSDLAEEQFARLVERLPVDSPIQIVTQSARYYPYGEAACHTLGFVSTKDRLDEDGFVGEELRTFHLPGKAGRTGLERAFDERLTGRTGGEIWVVDPSGFRYERTTYRPPTQGENLTTTIDIDLQLAVEAAMSEYIGAAIALHVETGEVLAVVSRPGFDLNDLSPFLSFEVDRQIREKGAWLNRSIQGLYPPGSTFKLVTASAGLRHGFIEADTEINCPGWYFVGRRRFHCHNHAGHGLETLEESIRDSCNVFYYDRAVEMGIERIAEEARLYGLDEPTGIGLNGETRRMLVPDPDWKARRFFGERWFEGDTANVAIGQGDLLVTPLQMASFAASIARGETRTLPTLEYDPTRFEFSHPGELIELPGNGLARMREGMRMAGETGTAKKASLPDVPVAGKTGTAQVRVEGEPQTLAWTIGYAPADAPEVAFAVVIEGTEPGDNFHGGSTAAPVVQAFLRAWREKQGAQVASSVID